MVELGRRRWKSMRNQSPGGEEEEEEEEGIGKENSRSACIREFKTSLENLMRPFLKVRS